GRARSVSRPNPAHGALSAPASLRAPSPSPLSRSDTRQPTRTQQEGESTSHAGSVMSIPVESNIAPARLYPSAPNSPAPSLVLTAPQSSRRNSIDDPPDSPANLPVGDG